MRDMSFEMKAASASVLVKDWACEAARCCDGRGGDDGGLRFYRQIEGG